MIAAIILELSISELRANYTAAHVEPLWSRLFFFCFFFLKPYMLLLGEAQSAGHYCAALALQ